MKNIAVFASGNGSNFQAIVDAVNDQRLDANIKILVCDKPGAYAVERAIAAGINYFEFRPKDFSDKAEYEQKISELLNELKVDWIVLAGYMRIIGPTLLSEYQGKIVNIHPSLLPSFPGKDAIGQAVRAKVQVSGVTVHYVDEGMDTGPIIAQETIEVDEAETVETLQGKTHRVEHQLYPAVLQMLLAGSRRNEK